MAADTGAYLIGTAIESIRWRRRYPPTRVGRGFSAVCFSGWASALAWYGLYWKLDADMMIHAWGEGTRLKLLWAGFGLTVALAAVGGDLIESKFKRLIGIKDSGSIIPATAYARPLRRAALGAPAAALLLL